MLQMEPKFIASEFTRSSASTQNLAATGQSLKSPRFQAQPEQTMAFSHGTAQGDTLPGRPQHPKP